MVAILLEGAHQLPLEVVRAVRQVVLEGNHLPEAPVVPQLPAPVYLHQPGATRLMQPWGVSTWGDPHQRRAPQLTEVDVEVLPEVEVEAVAAEEEAVEEVIDGSGAGQT